MSKTSSIISISDYISDNETSIKEKLPWHMEDISSTELTEDEERLLPMTGEEKEKRKEEKRRQKGEEKKRQMLGEKKKEEEKQSRILEAKKRGEVVGIVGRAETDKKEDIVPDKLPKEKEKYLQDKKKEEKYGERREGRSHRKDFDGRARAWGSYSRSPVRKPHAVDEKEKREKMQEKKVEPQKNKEIGVNTIITGALWARIIDNLLETKDLLEIAPLPPSK
uniref:Uncharacterized protein n=1 Tax=Meloidogyne javanica TaxID=6303 RepID=A0A915M9B8_MELJA